MGSACAILGWGILLVLDRFPASRRPRKAVNRCRPLSNGISGDAAGWFSRRPRIVRRGLDRGIGLLKRPIPVRSEEVVRQAGTLRHTSPNHAFSAWLASFGFAAPLKALARLGGME
jgi:hypothetical protein